VYTPHAQAVDTVFIPGSLHRVNERQISFCFRVAEYFSKQRD